MRDEGRSGIAGASDLQAVEVNDPFGGNPRASIRRARSRAISLAPASGAA